MKIGLISDTHGYLGSDVLQHLYQVDEIWHAGDVGSMKVLETLEDLGKPLRIVYGNIDDHTIRRACHNELVFHVGNNTFFMIHIAGSLGRYHASVRERLKTVLPDFLICGHSHICKVARDPVHNLLYINPGACGIYGFHHYRTMLLLEIKDNVLSDMKVVELGLRGKSHIG